MRTRRFLALLALLAPLPLGAQQPLTLQAAVQIGRTTGVQAEIARYNARAADRRAAAHTGELLPSVEGTGGLSRQTNNLTEFGIALPGMQPVTDPFNLYALRARATQTIWNGGTWNRVKGSHAEAAAASYDATATADAGGLTAGLAWLAAVSAEETVNAREADSTVAAALLRMAREQLQAGTSAAIDVTRAEVNAAAIRGQLVTARNIRDRARLDLNRALFFAPDTVLVLADSLESSTAELPPDALTAVSFALEHRPETAAERERVRALAAQRSATTWDHLPSVTGFGQVNDVGQGIDSMHFSYAFGVQVTVPIFDGMRRQRRAQEQNARIEAQDLRERDVRHQIEIEARGALLDIASAREGVEVATERLRLAEQEMRQAEERFRAGAAGSVETSQAQLGLFSARDGLIQSKVNLGSARVRAYRALGAFDRLK
jgi:outer membrane protein